MEKMSLEEAIELLNWLKFELKFIKGNNEKMTKNIQLSEKAINAVLNELENTIPTEAIEKKIQEYKGLKEIDMQAYEEQIKPLKELLNKE